MRNIILPLILSMLLAAQAGAARSLCYYAEFAMLGFSNNDFSAKATLYFAAGSGSRGPVFVGVSAAQSNDTLFLRIIHDARVAMPTFHSVMTDTVLYSNVDPGVSCVNI